MEGLFFIRKQLQNIQFRKYPNFRVNKEKEEVPKPLDER